MRRSIGKILNICGAVLVIAVASWLRTHSNSSTGVIPHGTSVSQSAGGYDLGHDEELGGHTLRRHVGRTDEQLIERLRREPNISAASTYNDRATAEATVAQTLREEASRVESWLTRPDAHPNLALRFHGRDPIGRSIRRGENNSEICYDAAVILRWDGDQKFHVLTTYPEPARAR